MKKFSFVPPTDQAAQEQNWRNLISSTQAQEYDPYNGEGGVARGFTNANTANGVYHTLGPVCYVYISVPGNAIWIAGANFNLPFAPAQRGSTTIVYSPADVVPTNYGTATVYYSWRITKPAGYWQLRANIGENAGATANEQVVFQFWYFI